MTGSLVAAYDYGRRAGARDRRAGRRRSGLELGLRRYGWTRQRAAEVEACETGYRQGITWRRAP